MLKKHAVSFFLCSMIILIFVFPLSSAEPHAYQNSSLELKYDSDSSSYSLYNLSSGGHAVYFTNPGEITITGIRIFGQMYGNNPDSPVHVRIWDKKFNGLYAYDTTYKEFPRDDADWMTVPVPPFSRTGDFYVAVFTQSALPSSPGGGVSIGYDTSTKSGHSHIVLGGNNKKVQDVAIGPDKNIPLSLIDWKIRVLYSEPTDAVPTPAPASQQQDTPLPPVFPVPLIIIALLAVAGVSAAGYSRYRQKPKLPVSPSLASSPAVLPVRRHHDVFISYAHTDKPVADAVCNKLESRNIRCWIAPRDVPGKNFPEAIIDGIEGSRIMVIIFSSHSDASEHVIREVTTAINASLIIIPFRIEDVLPSKSMKYLIGTPHGLDAITPPLDQHLDTLVITVNNFLSGGDRETDR